jgi:hypothetical protein
MAQHWIVCLVWHTNVLRDISCVEVRYEGADEALASILMY